MSVGLLSGLFGRPSAQPTAPAAAPVRSNSGSPSWLTSSSRTIGVPSWSNSSAKWRQYYADLEQPRYTQTLVPGEPGLIRGLWGLVVDGSWHGRQYAGPFTQGSSSGWGGWGGNSGGQTFVSQPVQTTSNYYNPGVRY